MNHQTWSKNPSLERCILKQYLTEFPEDVENELQPIEVKQKNDRIVLVTRAYDGFKLITFKSSHNGFVKFNKSDWYSGYEHALGDCINFLNGVI